LPGARCLNSAILNSASFDAIGGCTRALAGTADTDATFATSDAATLGSLRAFGDRIAVRHRYQDPLIHLGARPADPVAAAIYDALALARLDALGVQWLPGIARNLLAHPGADDGGVRWWAFAVFSGREAPREKQAAAGRVRAALSSADAVTLADLARCPRR
jgi:cobalamin biosynthesis protein CobT